MGVERACWSGRRRSVFKWCPRKRRRRGAGLGNPRRGPGPPSSARRQYTARGTAPSVGPARRFCALRGGRNETSKLAASKRNRPRQEDAPAAPGGAVRRAGVRRSRVRHKASVPSPSGAGGRCSAQQRAAAFAGPLPRVRLGPCHMLVGCLHDRSARAARAALPPRLGTAIDILAFFAQRYVEAARDTGQPHAPQRLRGAPPSPPAPPPPRQPHTGPLPKKEEPGSRKRKYLRTSAGP